MTDQVNFHPVVTMCQSIQNHLFNIGADICSVDKSASQLTAISQCDIEILESGIDAMNKTLQPLKSLSYLAGTRLPLICISREPSVGDANLTIGNGLNTGRAAGF